MKAMKMNPGKAAEEFVLEMLGGAKKRLGVSDPTRGLHGHSCLRVRVGTLELAVGQISGELTAC
jgi:hypothetical protein